MDAVGGGGCIVIFLPSFLFLLLQLPFVLLILGPSDMIDYVKMSHFKIILETYPMICLCNKYPYQNTLEYKTNKKGLVSKII
jgi:hypothetical protein